MLTEREMNILLKAQQGELDAVLMYKALAKTVKDPEDREIFLQLAGEEGHHAAVFHMLTKKCLKPKRTKAIVLPMMYRILGKKRLYPLIAQGEYAAERDYASVSERFPEVESVQADEKRHGDMVMALLNRQKKGAGSMLKKTVFALLLISLGRWIGIHRRVILAWMTGDGMPEMPVNHPHVCRRK